MIYWGDRDQGDSRQRHIGDEGKCNRVSVLAMYMAGEAGMVGIGKGSSVTGREDIWQGRPVSWTGWVRGCGILVFDAHVVAVVRLDFFVA